MHFLISFGKTTSNSSILIYFFALFWRWENFPIPIHGVFASSSRNIFSLFLAKPNSHFLVVSWSKFGNLYSLYKVGRKHSEIVPYSLHEQLSWVFHFLRRFIARGVVVYQVLIHCHSLMSSFRNCNRIGNFCLLKSIRSFYFWMTTPVFPLLQQSSPNKRLNKRMISC